MLSLTSFAQAAKPAKINFRSVGLARISVSSDLRLSFNKDILTVGFEKTIFSDKSDISGYEFSRLEYNRQTPEKGFVIKTEKRDKSSANEQ